MATEWGWNERAGHDTRVGGGRGEQKGEINFFVFLILPSAGQKEPEGEKKLCRREVSAHLHQVQDPKSDRCLALSLTGLVEFCSNCLIDQEVMQVK